jgi:hypothetical protein
MYRATSSSSLAVGPFTMGAASAWSWASLACCMTASVDGCDMHSAMAESFTYWWPGAKSRSAPPSLAGAYRLTTMPHA